MERTAAVPWQSFADEAPDLAAATLARLAASRHHVLATLRRDGSPRVSGIEVRIVGGGLTAGSMYGSRKALDLRRDGRFALHANPGDGSMAGGDAKLAGVAIEIADAEGLRWYVHEVRPPEPFHAFRLLLDEVVLTSLHPKNDRLVIQTWRPGRGVRSVDRF